MKGLNNQFILNYQGAKYKETKELYDVDFSKYDTIIECFGGSFGFSRFQYEIKELKDVKYIIVDNDKELIDLYNFIKNHDDPNIFIEEYNSIMKTIFDKYKTGKDSTQIKLSQSVKYINDNIKDEIMKFLLMHNISSGNVSRVYYKNKCKFIDMIKKSEFIYCNFEDFDLTKYDKEKTLIYLDPPYLLECNTYYCDTNDMRTFYEKLTKIFDLYNCIFIHSYNYLLDNIFNKYMFMKYDKTYGNSGNKRIHMVYYNNP
jgi:site-specific DNA-adenine methylase